MDLACNRYVCRRRAASADNMMASGCSSQEAMSKDSRGHPIAVRAVELCGSQCGQSADRIPTAQFAEPDGLARNDEQEKLTL